MCKAWRATCLVLLLALLASCQSILRVKGSEPSASRPVLEAAELPFAELRVWVIVPSLLVRVYPLKGKTQQPMLQFTGDQERFARGWGTLAMLAAPDQFHDGEPVRYFEDKVLWSDRLRVDDGRTFTLWLRENNKSAPTRFDEELAPVDRVAELVEDVSGLAGFRIPARRALNVSVQAIKELQQDWLILRWSCPWRHVLDAARSRFADASQAKLLDATRSRLASDQRTVVLRARLVSAETVRGEPVAELEVLFVLQRIARPLPQAIAR